MEELLGLLDLGGRYAWVTFHLQMLLKMPRSETLVIKYESFVFSPSSSFQLSAEGLQQTEEGSAFRASCNIWNGQEFKPG